MKDSVRSFTSIWRWTVGGLAAAMLLSAQTQAQNTLSNLNSIADLNLSTSAGMYNWTVNGVDQLAQQWFWFRVGNSAETPINSISAPTITQTLAKLLTVTYANSSYSVQISYNLTGNSSPGSGGSSITESIKLSNLTSSPLDFHFFEYAAVNLGNTAAGQTVNISSVSASTQVLQTHNGGIFNVSVGPLAASHVQAGTDGSILTSLTDGTATTLNDVASATGNANWALQWDLTIPANNTQLLSHLMTVPEPSSFALLLLASGGLWCWRRRD